MQEHVGKRRRKEVRAAVDMRAELRNSMMFLIFILVLGVVASLTVSLSMPQLDPHGDNVFIETLPTVILLLFAILFGMRSYKWTGLKREYDEHRRRYNITKDDMRKLKGSSL